MKKLTDLTLLDCEYMYKFLNKTVLCSNGEVIEIQEENKGV